MLKTKLLTSCAVNRHRKKSLITLCFALIFSLVVTACGYRLSGIDDKEHLFSPLLKKVAIEGLPKYDAFRIQLKKDLLSYRMKVVTKESATARIIVKNKNIRQQAITIGDDAKVREYLLIANIDFYAAVPTASGEPKQSPVQSIQSETTYTYYPQHISVSLNEKKRALAFLYKDMSLKLIRQINHRLLHGEHPDM